MKKVIFALIIALTLLALSAQSQTQSVVILDLQKQIDIIKSNQSTSGKLLIEARQNRIEGLVSLTAFAVIGTALVYGSKDNTVVKGFGFGLITVGGSVSVYKLVESFNKIGKAGRVLTGKR